MTTYTEKRFFHWVEDEISVTLREKSGSYGGGSEVLIIQGFDDEDILGWNGNLRDADQQK